MRYPLALGLCASVLFITRAPAFGASPEDASAQGTVPALDFAPGVSGSIGADFHVVGARRVLTVADSDGVALWATDGSVAGTELLQRLVGNEDAQQEIRLASIGTGSRVFFVAHDPATGTELYVTDGTPAGTALVRDIHPDQNNPFVPPLPVLAHGEGIFFVANERVTGWELWLTDGTASGTLVAVDFLPGS